MAKQGSTSVPRAWSKRQLRRYPELLRFSPGDPVAHRWCGWMEHGWCGSVGTGVLAIFLWTFVCVVIAGFLTEVGVSAPNAVVRAIARFITGALKVSWLPGCWFAAHLSLRASTRHAARMLRAELRRRGIPICIACGYEGGDISAPRCPECGAPSGA